jgi:hypothetical protein
MRTRAAAVTAPRAHTGAEPRPSDAHFFESCHSAGRYETRELFSDPDPTRAERAMKAMLGMSKLDIAALRNAADGVPAT